jgi:hypothetical protein
MTAVLPVRQQRRSRPSRSSQLLKTADISTDFQSPDAKSDFVSDGPNHMSAFFWLDRWRPLAARTGVEPVHQP